MPRTGMGRHTHNHYNRVARNMNRYLAAYHTPYHQQVDGFQPTHESLGEYLENSLYSYGFPTSIASIGYYFGKLFDGYL